MDAPIITPYRRKYHGSVSAVRREMRLRISGPHAIVVEIAARMASREGRPSNASRNFRKTDWAPRSRTALRIASGRGSSASAGLARNRARVFSSTLIRDVEALVPRIGQAGMDKEVDQRSCTRKRSLD